MNYKTLTYLILFFLPVFVYAGDLAPELEIYGTKEIEFNNYSYSGDFNHFLQRNPQVITDSKFDQHTRFHVRGDLGEGTKINAVFDDSNEREEDEKILMEVSRGDHFQMALGRITLDLGGSRYILNNKKALGIALKKKIGDFSFGALVSRSEGVEERETLSGKGLQREYILKKRPVVAGSEKIFMDGRLLQAGSDYKFDYEGGSFQLEHKLLPVESTTTLIVEYESSRDGSAYKNRIFATRALWSPSLSRRFGVSFAMEKDQVSEDMMKITSLPPHQLSLFGLDGTLKTPSGFRFDFEMAFSQDKQDIVSRTLPVLDGSAMDVSMGFLHGRHKILVRKERLDPKFRSIGKNEFVALGEDSGFVGDVDQQSVGYQYQTTRFMIDERYRNSKTNLDDDPSKEVKKFDSLSGNTTYQIGGFDLRLGHNHENTRSYKNVMGVEQISGDVFLEKKNMGARKMLMTNLYMDVFRENERKGDFGKSDQSFQTSKVEFFSQSKSRWNWKAWASLRDEEDVYLSKDLKKILSESLSVGYKARNFDLTLEQVNRNEEDFIAFKEENFDSSSMQLDFKPDKKLEYNAKLKKELKRRFIRETSNLDLAEIKRREQNQVTWVTPLNPVQTLVASQQVRWRPNRKMFHRLTWRTREEEEKIVNKTLNSSDNLNWDFKWDLRKDLRWNYRWDRNDRMNLDSSLDRISWNYGHEITKSFQRDSTLSLKFDSFAEKDEWTRASLDEDTWTLRGEKTFSTKWQVEADLIEKTKEGLDEKKELSVGVGATWTPGVSDIRLGIKADQGKSEDLKSGKKSDLRSLNLNLNQRVMKDAWLEGSYKLQTDAPSILGNGFMAKLMHLKVSVDF